MRLCPDGLRLSLAGGCGPSSTLGLVLNTQVESMYSAPAAWSSSAVMPSSPAGMVGGVVGKVRPKAGVRVLDGSARAVGSATVSKVLAFLLAGVLGGSSMLLLESMCTVTSCSPAGALGVDAGGMLPDVVGPAFDGRAHVMEPAVGSEVLTVLMAGELGRSSRLLLESMIRVASLDAAGVIGGVSGGEQSEVVKLVVEALVPDDPAHVVEPAVGSVGSTVSLAGVPGCPSAESSGNVIMLIERSSPVEVELEVELEVAGDGSGKASTDGAIGCGVR